MNLEIGYTRTIKLRIYLPLPLTKYVTTRGMLTKGRGRVTCETRTLLSSSGYATTVTLTPPHLAVSLALRTPPSVPRMDIARIRSSRSSIFTVSGASSRTTCPSSLQLINGQLYRRFDDVTLLIAPAVVSTAHTSAAECPHAPGRSSN